MKIMSVQEFNLHLIIYARIWIRKLPCCNPLEFYSYNVALVPCNKGFKINPCPAGTNNDHSLPPV